MYMASQKPLWPKSARIVHGMTRIYWVTHLVDRIAAIYYALVCTLPRSRYQASLLGLLSKMLYYVTSRSNRLSIQSDLEA